MEKDKNLEDYLKQGRPTTRLTHNNKKQRDDE